MSPYFWAIPVKCFISFNFSSFLFVGSSLSRLTFIDDQWEYEVDVSDAFLPVHTYLEFPTIIFPDSVMYSGTGYQSDQLCSSWVPHRRQVMTNSEKMESFEYFSITLEKYYMSIMCRNYVDSVKTVWRVI